MGAMPASYVLIRPPAPKPTSSELPSTRFSPRQYRRGDAALAPPTDVQSRRRPLSFPSHPPPPQRLEKRPPLACPPHPPRFDCQAPTGNRRPEARCYSALLSFSKFSHLPCCSSFSLMGPVPNVAGRTCPLSTSPCRPSSDALFPRGFFF